MTYGSPRVPVRWDGTVRDLGIVHHFVTSGWVRYTTARDLTMELRFFPLELRYASTKNGRVMFPWYSIMIYLLRDTLGHPSKPHGGITPEHPHTRWFLFVGKS